MDAVARWLSDNARWVESGDRPLSWRRLKKILVEYGCEFDVPTRGGRINIARTIETRSGILGRRKQRTLDTQLHYIDDNRDVSVRAVHKIRQDLELDDMHGIDSGAFFDNAPVSPSDFIVRYRKTIMRLARL